MVIITLLVILFFFSLQDDGSVSIVEKETGMALAMLNGNIVTPMRVMLPVKVSVSEVSERSWPNVGDADRAKGQGDGDGGATDGSSKGKADSGKKRQQNLLQGSGGDGSYRGRASGYRRREHADEGELSEDLLGGLPSGNRSREFDSCSWYDDNSQGAGWLGDDRGVEDNRPPTRRKHDDDDDDDDYTPPQHSTQKKKTAQIKRQGKAKGDSGEDAEDTRSRHSGIGPGEESFLYFVFSHLSLPL